MSRSITPNPVSSQAITVSSSAGFNAGDLVYFNGSTGDYGTPPVSAAGATVSVPITAPVPLLGGLAGANSSDVGIYGGSGTKGFAAVLTNGNIVQAFINASTFEPSFRIVTTSGTVVVAVTSISATFVQNARPNIAVAALTGGGFVVAWNNSSGGTGQRPCYAVYSNTGTVVTAAQQDTTAGVGINNSYSMRVAATPSGGFIIAFYSTATNFAYARGYGATGTGVFAWVTLSATGASEQVGLAVRGNGEFMLAGTVNGGSNVYAIWSATGTVVLGSTSFAPVSGGVFSQPAVDATCLSDGTTFVIGYSITPSNNTLAFRFLPTGNVLSSEFYIPIPNTYKSNGLYGYPVGVHALSGNRFILTGASSVSNSYPVAYAVFDSAGVCLSGTSGTTSTAATPIYIPQAYFPFSANLITVLETPSGFISVYYPNQSGGTQYSMQVSTINATTYALVNVTPSTQVAGSAVSAPTAYARSGSSPLGAAYSITPGGYGAAGTFGAVVKAPEIVDSLAAVNLSITTLPDGRVLIGYQDSSNNIKVAVYSIAGVLTQTILIAAGAGAGSLQTFSKLCIASLTSGKFVISYATSSTTSDVRLYSSTFTQIGSTVSITGMGGGTNNGYYAVVSGLTGDRYILAYPNPSNYPTYRVYDNTNSVIVSDTLLISLDFNNLSVCGYSSGGFVISGRYASTTNQKYTAQYGNPSGNTFTQTVAFALVTGLSTDVQNNRTVANTNGAAFTIYNAGGNSVYAYPSNLVGNTTGGATPYSGSFTSIQSSAVGVTGTGVPVITGQTSGVMQLANGLESQVALSSTLFQPYVSGSFSSLNAMTPSYGPNVGIAYIDVNQKINYAIVCGSSIPSSITVTSNDPSTPVPIYPGATSASPAIQNTVFAGVALQTVPPGGAGLVQVNGTAQLGSTYPAGTTYRAFDHQSQGVPGVKGTITGRTITLQGNT